MNAQDLAVGAASATFTFTTALTAVPTGVWTIGGVEFDIVANKAAVDAVNVAGTQFALWTALQNPLFNGVAVEANIAAYETTMIAPVYTSVIQIIGVVEEINEDAVAADSFVVVKEELEKAYPNELTINTLLAANFKAVNAANTAEYVADIFKAPVTDPEVVDLTTMAAIQDAIYLVNAEQAVIAAEAVTLDETGNATQTEIDEIQALHDAAKALVDALVPANPTEVGKLAAVQTNIDDAQTALDNMNEAITAAGTAMTEYEAAGGDVEAAAYTELVAELEKATKDEATIEGKTTALETATTGLTAVTDAEAAQAAFLAAKGLATDALYVAVTDAIAAYDAIDPLTLTALQTAISNLNDATKELVVYADILAATTETEMRALLFDLDASFLEFSSALKTDFAGYVFVNLAKEATAPADFAALNTLVFGTTNAGEYQYDYKTLLDGVNDATSIALMIDALEAISEDYAGLGLEAQSDVADAVIQKMPAAPGYTTIAEILTVAGL